VGSHEERHHLGAGALLRLEPEHLLGGHDRRADTEDARFEGGEHGEHGEGIVAPGRGELGRDDQLGVGEVAVAAHRRRGRHHRLPCQVEGDTPRFGQRVHAAIFAKLPAPVASTDRAGSDFLDIVCRMEGVEAVTGHYGSTREEDRITTGMGQLELLRTREILRRHLPAPPARILDVGGATGVHAAWLAADGYQVHVVDLAPRHVEKVAKELASLGVTAELGDARGLAQPDASADSVLLLGPLYHLTDRSERLQALREAARVVRPGGVIAVAAISRFASLFDGLARGFLFDPEFRPIVERDLAEGQHRNPDEREHWFTTAYFHEPEQLREEISGVGLEVVELVGIEGLAGWLGHLGDRWETPEGRAAILYSARAVEREPSLLGLSGHLLAMARSSP